MVCPPFPFSPLPSDPPGKIFGIKDARRRVLEHLRHKNQHLYEPGARFTKNLRKNPKFNVSFS